MKNLSIIQSRLLESFKSNKSNLIQPYTELKQIVLNNIDTYLIREFKTEIYTLSFYHSELKKYI
jgi:hypothetical protein